MSPRRPQTHGGDCECPTCLLLDVEAHLRQQGRDTSRFWDDLPEAAWAGMAPATQARVLAEQATPAPAPSVVQPSAPAPDGGGRVERPATPESVRVPVYCMHAGAWARFAGTRRDGTHVVLSGALIAGPDEVTAVGTPMLAVLIRTYRDDEPDQVLYMPTDAYAELTDDPADREARRRHVVAPVFAPGASRVELYRRVPATRKGQRDRWVPETHTDVTADQLAAWEHGDPGVRLGAVYRHHAAIPAGVL